MDWTDYDDKMVHYGREYVQFSRRPYNQNSISFRHLVGKYEGYLYAAFEVTDSSPILRRKNSVRVDRNDHLIIAMTSPDGEFFRYVVSAHADGWVNAWQITNDITDSSGLILQSQIQGYWRTTDKGYNIELRLPLSFLGNKLGVCVL